MADDRGSHACCSGDVSSFAERAPGTARMAADPVDRSDRHHEEIELPGGTFAMGDSSGDANRGDGELPVRQVEVDPFAIDATSVTNDAFAAFVDATGYVTDAEDLGVSAVFHLAVRASDEDVLGAVPGTPWWLAVRGANWRHPAGPASSLEGIGDHPVVQVSWADAAAYASWAGRRLPTEAEWEYASRGGLASKKYPWGDEEVDERGWRANIWQGRFPAVNTVEDGFLTTAPVHSFEPNGFGLWQTVGNVWEWCSDVWRDGSDKSDPAVSRVMRGGSYLCHISYCNRCRNSARTSNTADSASGNVGFRTVRALG